MDALDLARKLAHGSEFANEDLQYLYENFVSSWKVRIHSVVEKAIRETAKQDGDARDYFYTTVIFTLIEEMENYNSPEDREIIWGLFIEKIADILRTELQVKIVYQISL